VKFQQKDRRASNYLGRFEIATNDDGLCAPLRGLTVSPRSVQVLLAEE
jgi:hypothetical protein